VELERAAVAEERLLVLLDRHREQIGRTTVGERDLVLDRAVALDDELDVAVAGRGDHGVAQPAAPRAGARRGRRRQPVLAAGEPGQREPAGRVGDVLGDAAQPELRGIEAAGAAGAAGTEEPAARATAGAPTSGAGRTADPDLRPGDRLALGVDHATLDHRAGLERDHHAV